MTEAAGITKIQQIQRIEQLKNSTNHPSENQLLSYERYCLQMQSKKQFNKINQHEQELDKTFLHLDEQGKEIFKQINDFVEKYNKFVYSLHDYDALSGTKHVGSVHNVFLLYMESFHTVGLKENDDCTISFQPRVYQKELSDSDRSVQEIIQTLKGSVLACYQSLAKQINTKQTPYDTQPMELKGIIIEEEG
jgi:hypothetical protein